MAIDQVSIEVAAALESRGLPYLLVKGPVLSDWLYPETIRQYGDTDILVSPDDLPAAQAALRDLGFTPYREPDTIARGMPPFHAWTRNRMWVDLDCRMTGLSASPATQWQGLSREREPWRVAQSTVWTTGSAARALLLATHAAQHGIDVDGPLEDLARGIAALPFDLWREAWALARELGGQDAFGAGLRLVPSGARLADRLGLPAGSSRGVRLQALGAPPLVVGLDRLTAIRGMRGKIELMRTELLPSEEFLRWWSPIASRGRVGMFVTKIWRPVWFLLQIPSALLTLMRSRSMSRGDRP
jgi:Uncharacterised nucleotidyltransferase